MKESPTFSIANLIRRSPELAEFDAVLTLLPQAALLVDSHSQQILLANGKASELTGFSRAELSEMKLAKLFGFEPVGKKTARLPLDTQTLELVKHNGSRAVVLLTPVIPPPGGKRVLITLEDGSQRKLQETERQRRSQFWEDLQGLAVAALQDDPGEALTLALKAGSGMTGASALAVYQAGSASPGMKRQASWGNPGLLPEELPAQDLGHLGAPHLWRQGKRPLASLHRFARNQRLAYLVSAPLGQANAAIGLVALAGETDPPSEHSLQVCQLLANAITNILQQHALRAELQLRQESQQHTERTGALVSDSVQDGLLLLSPDLRVQKINPAAAEMLGYSHRETVGQPVDHLLIGTEALRPALAAAQRGSATFNLGSSFLYRRSGEAFRVRIRTIPILKDKIVEAILVLIQDQSEQEQIREQNRQIEQQAVLGEVMATFAHDVRNPINNISTGLQVLAMKFEADPVLHEQMNRMLQDCDRLEELMKGLLALARPPEQMIQKVNLAEMLKRLLDRQSVRMTRSGVRYNIKVETGQPVVEGNPQTLDQLFTNLVTNAIQAMKEVGGGSLTVKIERQDGPEGRPYVLIKIADTGPGIPKESLDRIFNPFFTTKKDGTGLGLAIARRTVTAHGGTISVNSFTGGTVFQVQLPAVEEINI